MGMPTTRPSARVARVLLGIVALCGCTTRDAGRELPAFDQRVRAYMAVHDRLDGELPAVAPTADRGTIEARQRELAAKLGAVPELRSGAVFAPEIATAVRERLRAVMDGPSGKNVRGVILDANPQGTRVAAGSPYPREAPLSTVPMAVLGALPPLPDALEYRFVGRDLILRDVAASWVVDVLPESFD